MKNLFIILIVIYSITHKSLLGQMATESLSENVINKSVLDLKIHTSVGETIVLGLIHNEFMNQPEFTFFENLTNVNLIKQAYFLNFHVGDSKITNKDIIDNGWASQSKLGYQFEIGFYNKFSPLFAYGIGLGMSSYATDISIDLLRDTLTGLRDLPQVTPRDRVDWRAEHLDISEETSLVFIDIPVFLEIGNPNIDKIGYFIRIGTKLSMPLSNNLNGSGNYSVKGYYPEYQVEIAGVPELGFVEAEQLTPGDCNFELNPLVLSGFVSGGISLPINKVWVFQIGAQFVKQLNDISKNKDFEESSLRFSRNHLLENDESPTTAQSLGVTVGFQYRLKIY